MSGRRLAAGGVLLGSALWTGLSPGGAGAARLLEADWIEARSPHFRVLGSADAPVEETATLLERHHAIARAALPEWSAPADRLRVLVLSARDLRGSSTHNSGLYRRGAGHDDILVRAPGPTSLPTIVGHEYGHALLRRQHPGASRCVSEGWADFWSTAALEGATAILGRPPRHWRLARRDDGASLLALIDPAEPPAGAAGKRFYARCWAAMHFLALAEAIPRAGGLGSTRLFRLLDLVDSEPEEPRAALAVTRNPGGGSGEDTSGTNATEPVRRELEALQPRFEAYLEEPRLPSLSVPLEIAWSDPGARLQRIPAALGVATLAASLLDRGELELARHTLARAQALDPDHGLVLEGLGRLKRLEGDPYRALDLLSRARAADGASDEIVTSLSVAALAAASSPARSPDAFDLDLLPALPELAPTWIELAAIFAQRGDPDRAVEASERAVALRPEEGWTRLLLARALLAAGGGDQAAAAARTAATLTLSGDDPVEHNNVCWYGALSSFAAIVLPVCDRAVELRPAHGLSRDSRAVARALTGDRAGAIADLETSLAAEGDLAPEIRAQRTAWLDQLRRGLDPFDAALLDRLSDLPF
ncbi:MAG TPA: tetratricopeptide repeat protein [Thermoanaerobaculia bacterium]|nr:tetratricopeptide repeat protein [Thermoanaerobaculia bacterium]